MKNRRIIASWDKAEPDSIATERMLGAILARSHSGRPERGGASSVLQALSGRRLVPIAACLVFAIALVAAVGSSAGWFGGKALTAELGGGSTLSFYQGDLPGSAGLAFDFETSSRDLTASESRVFFGDLPATAHATFNTEDHSFVRLEGRIGETKVIMAASGMPLSDTSIEGNEAVSQVAGVSVTAGYFITDANSRGTKNIIYFASFALDGVQVYVEHGGDESDSEALCNETASVIESLIQNGPPDLSQITE
jgi:hypothetical protein